MNDSKIMMRKIQLIPAPLLALGGSIITVSEELDIDYPYLHGVGIYVADSSAMGLPILKFTKIGQDYYLPDNFPATAIACNESQSINPDDKFFTILDEVKHDGKRFECTIEDATIGANYTIYFMFLIATYSKNAK